MAEDNGLKRVKLVLLLSIAVDVVYGVGFLIVPGVLRDMAGGTPVELGWIRWSGGVLLALALMGYQASRDPRGQGIVITGLTVAPLLTGAGLLYTLLFEMYTVHAWFILLPCVILFVLFGLMAWARQGARGSL